MSQKFIPPGWTYNPSSWGQRIPIVVLAVVGGAIAVYLALFQYKVVADVWEPLFGNGSRKILTSPTSFLLPVSDAALGALAYLMDAVTGIIGGRRRWQTMPWMVIIFGIFVGPLSLVSIGLVIAQPVLYAHWCTLCLVSAVISIVMVGPSMDEVLASLQYLKSAQRSGRSLMRIFWGKELHAVEYSMLPPPKENKFLVWPLWICLALSGWLMASPDVLYLEKSVANAQYILGPMIFTFSCIALWETTRSLRFLNVGAAVLLIAFLVMNVSSGENLAGNILIAGIIGMLSVIPVPHRHKNDTGWRALTKSL